MIRNHKAFARLVFASVAVVISAWAASGQAQGTRTWRLEPTSDLWSVGTNWLTNVAPVANDSVAFSVTTGPTTLTNDITAGTQFNGITFNAGASAYTLTGNQITLGGSVINNSVNLQTIALPLDLAASRTFAANSGGITVSGAITGTGGITKDGRDTLTLAGTNTFSGNIAVRGGTLLLDYSAGGNTADPLGTSSAITLNMGTLVLKGRSSGTTTETISALNMGDNLGVANTLRFDANGGDGIDLTVTTFGLAAQAGSTQNFNLVDLSSSSGNSLVASGLSATASVINDVLMHTISAGNGRANLVVRDSAGYGFATLSGATSGTLGRLTAGTDLTATNSGSATNFRLTTAGTLTRTAALDYSTITLDSSAGAVTLDMGSNNLTNNGSGRGILVTGANDVAMPGTGRVEGAGSLWIHNYSSGTFTFGLSSASNTGTSLMFGGTGLTVWTGTTPITASGDDKFYIEGITFRPTTAQSWVATDSGTPRLARGNVFVSSGGVLEVGADLNGATPGDLTNPIGNIRFYGDSGVSAFGGDRVVGFRTSGTGDLQSLTWGASNFLTQANGSTDGNFIFKLSSDRSDSLVTVENNIALGSLVRTVEVANGSAAVDADLSGVLSGVGGLTKTGAGTLRLSGANTFTGPATIAAGTLVMGNATALGSGAYSTDNAGTLSFGSLSAASLGSLSGSTGLALQNADSNALALSVGGNGGSTTFSGVLSGPGSLTKAGAGTMTLAADNTYAGTTTVNAGTLLVGTGGTTGSLGAGSVTLGGGRLALNRSDTVTLSQAISGSGALALLAPIAGASNVAVVQLAAANTFSGTTEIGSSTASSPLILAATDTAFGSSTVIVNLQVESRLRLRSADTTARTFANNLTFNGGAVNFAVLGSVGSGSLTFSGSTALPSSLRFEINGEPVTFSGATSGAAAGWRKTGGGTLTFAGAGGPTGQAVINNGTLVADYATADPLGTNAITLNGSLVLRGASGGGTSDTLGAITTTDFARSQIAVENGATISTGTLTAGGNLAPLLVDLTGGGSFTPSGLTSITDSNGVLVQGSSNARANLYVKDSGGIGFGTLSGSSIVRYTGATALTANNSDVNTNFAMSADVTRSAALAFNTLAIDATGGPVTLAMGASNLQPTGTARGLLVTGDSDAAITGSGIFTSGASFNIANYSTGTLSVALGLSNVAVVSNGPGLVTYSTTTNPADVYVTNGVTRFTGARNYTSAILRIYGGGVFEIGADLNGATAGDFTRPLINSGGGVALLGNGGFSAHGAERVVNLGGSAAELTWGASSFLTDRSGGDFQYVFKLGSAFANATLEFQNPIVLNGNTRTIDVARGTVAGGIDARLTGALSGDGASGLAKAGLGTLVLSATSSYLGETLVGAGRLVVDGSILASSGVSVSAGAELAGSGAVAAITGGGLVAPGNSPGILTAPSADLSGGLDFAFEFTQAGAPTWGSAANSGNDVLRLTDLSSPLVGLATTGNVFDIYFASTGVTYLGGLFTDQAASFESLISEATFNYFVRDASGPISYQGFNYAVLGSGDITRSTVQVAAATFADGTVTNGYTMQFVVVPEPGSLALAGLGLVATAWAYRRRRS